MSINYVAVLATCNRVIPRVAFQAPTFEKLVELLGQRFSDNIGSFLYEQEDEESQIYGVTISEECEKSMDIVEMYMCGTLKAGKYTPKCDEEKRFIDNWNLLYGGELPCNLCSRFVYIVIVRDDLPLSLVAAGLEVI